MTTGRTLDADVIVIGGGPAGTTLASLLAMDGHRVIVLERDVHPRDHVGESLTPSNNFVLNRIGFLPKMERAGFVHKEGVPARCHPDVQLQRGAGRVRRAVVPSRPRARGNDVARHQRAQRHLRGG
ncbi:MAG: FAD-binding protein [Actinobacteria bacterium]|nr:MAG: FAD-binding protein [Actinomycetota bacterium]